jgi:hypothetical protein
MRVPFALLVVAALLLSPLAAAGTTAQEPRLRQLLSIDGVGVVLSWSPVLDADLYQVFRGSSENDLQWLANTTANHYVDQHGSINYTYGVAFVRDGVRGPIQVITASGNSEDCVSTNSELHITVTLANCGLE